MLLHGIHGEIDLETVAFVARRPKSNPYGVLLKSNKFRKLLIKQECQFRECFAGIMNKSHWIGEIRLICPKTVYQITEGVIDRRSLFMARSGTNESNKPKHMSFDWLNKFDLMSNDSCLIASKKPIKRILPLLPIQYCLYTLSTNWIFPMNVVCSDNAFKRFSNAT